MNILHLDSSILGTHSVSRQLTAEVVQQLRAADASAGVTYRDLAADPVPVSDAALLAARTTPAAQRSADQAARVQRADAVVAELLAADVLVIGAPMYNFSIPSQLKAWIDLVSVAGGRAHADYLQLLLAFLGVTDVRVISAEGLAMGPGVREPALASARTRVAEIAAA
jgi:FMN-dependent NADH-azoreductase